MIKVPEIPFFVLVNNYFFCTKLHKMLFCYFLTVVCCILDACCLNFGLSFKN